MCKIARQVDIPELPNLINYLGYYTVYARFLYYDIVNFLVEGVLPVGVVNLLISLPLRAEQVCPFHPVKLNPYPVGRIPEFALQSPQVGPGAAVQEELYQ